MMQRVASAGLIALLAGCAYIKPPLPRERHSPAPLLLQPEAERLAIGEQKWGVAVSGGGIRSATVSMGALKALYDREVLERVDVVSTVSGGGYAAYWLFSREYRDPSRPVDRFGTKSFEESAFLQGACEVATTGNFISIPGVVARWMFGGSPRTAYSNAIRRTFGHANYNLPDSYVTERIVEPDTIEFHELRDLVHRRIVPNWVVNSRVYRPRARLGFADGMYELTPFHRGSASRGYREWDGERSYSVREGVAASAAAVAFPLNRTLPAHVTANPSEVLRLSDGGHGENLGALALVRRRVPNIIIIDAEQDRTFKLEAYANLQQRLLVWGDTLRVPALDSILAGHPNRWRPERGTSVGTIRGTGYVATVYYTKLSVPMWMDSVLAPNPAREAKAVTDRELIFHTLDRGERLGPQQAWDCRHLRSVDVDLHGLGIYEIQRFLSYEDLAAGDVPQRWSQFPHPHTFDLSYNLDRTMAQIAIGYLLGDELAHTINSFSVTPAAF
jgi:hypothetical protein